MRHEIVMSLGLNLLVLSIRGGGYKREYISRYCIQTWLAVCVACGMILGGAGGVWALEEGAGATEKWQYAAFLYNESTDWNLGDQQTISNGNQSYVYHKVNIKGEDGASHTYWVRNGYTITVEDQKRYEGARIDDVVNVYRSEGWIDADANGLLSSLQLQNSDMGITTLNGKNLQTVSTGTFIGVSNSSGTTVSSNFNYMINDNGKWIDAGGQNLKKYFKSVIYNNTLEGYTYNGKLVDPHDVYIIDGTAGVFVISENIYNGSVYGANNEILVTGKDDAGNYHSYWGAERNDPQETIGDKLTVGQYNATISELNANISKIHEDDIKQVQVQANTGAGAGGTIGLQTNGAQGSAGGAYIPGTITVSSTGGTAGTDVAIQFAADQGGSFTVTAGSQVVANPDVTGTNSGTLNTVAINGMIYNLTGTAYNAGNGIAIRTNRIDVNKGEGLTFDEDHKLVVEAGRGLAFDANALIVNTAENGFLFSGEDKNKKLQLNIGDGLAFNDTHQLIATGDAFAVKYDANADNTVNKDSITLGYKDGNTQHYTQIHNVANGTAANDAVNFSQLQEVNDAEDYVTGGSISAGNITLNRVKGGSVTISGLDTYVNGLDSYVTNAALDGNTLTITQNNQGKAFSIDLSSLTGGLSGTDYQLAANPAAGSNGKYTVTADGTLALTVQDSLNAANTKTVTLADIASKTQQDTNTNNIAANTQNISSNATQIDKLDKFAVKYDIKADGSVNRDLITLAGTRYDTVHKTGGTTITNVAYVTNVTDGTAGYNGSAAVNVDRLNDSIREAVESTAATDQKLVQGAGTGGDQRKIYGKVTDNGDVTLRVEDNTGKGYDVTVSDVASKTDLGDVGALHDGLKNTDGEGNPAHTSVVDAVNKVDDKVGDQNYSQVEGTEITDGDSSTTAIGKLDNRIDGLDGKIDEVAQIAGAHSTVSAGNGIAVTETIDGETKKKNYEVAIKDDVTLGGKDGQKGSISITGSEGNIAATGNISAGSVTAGTVIVNKDNQGTVSGLSNIAWDTAKVDKEAADGGYKGSTNAATESQLQQAMNGAVQYDTDKDGKVNKDSITLAGKDKGTTIHHVAPGELSADSKDAVNGSQLYATDIAVINNSQSINMLGGSIRKLDRRVNKVGAGAAALAALHPLDFDPDDKWDFAAGYGNYAGANAVAVGAYYRPNEDTMFNVGGSFGNGENMVNAGLSFKLGQGNGVSTSRVAMAKELKEVRTVVAKQDEQIRKLTALVNALVGAGQALPVDQAQMFPDVPENHWAYEAVQAMAKNGLVEGYPDGTFGGSRSMTRYEFAQIVHRALQKGTDVNARLISEFKPELKHIRIDVIAKDKEGNPAIERIRVNQ